MINITIDKNGKSSPSIINIGNQWENRDEELVFSFPEEFKDFNKYVIAYIKNKKTKEEIRQIFPITNDTFVVSSGVTRYAGSWHLYTLCKESPLDLDSDTVDIRAKNGERISISDSINAIISPNDIGDDVFQNFPMDENIKLIYDELFALKLEFEKADAVREENELARKHEEELRVQAENARVQAEANRVEAENNRTNAEGVRVQSETNRVSAEQSRVSIEKTRVNAENSRVETERNRTTAETSRTEAESSRVTAEKKRVESEDARVSAETVRTNNENARVQAESQRTTAETSRTEAESSRVTAEKKRETDTASALKSIEHVLNRDNEKYTSEFLENFFALQRTGEVYTVRFPLWKTSHTQIGEKLDANKGLVCEPSTKTILGRNDYKNIPLFKTYDVNAYVDDDGVRHITAMKGDSLFRDTGKNDVFVMGMSYYEKYWEDDQYWYYSRTDVPKNGYKIARECINKDGSIQPYGLYSKYVTGFIEGKPYSSKGLKPARYYASPTEDDISTDNSYNGMIGYMPRKGKYYCGGMACEYKYILTSFYLKYASLNSEPIMAGCSAYNFQYIASIQSSDNNTYFPVTKSQANSIVVGAYVSVGYPYEKKTNTDRVYSSMHRYADDVKVLKKESLDDNNVAIYLDIETPFSTMPVALSDGTNGDVYITSMHWRSGFSDDVLDRDGCPCNEKSELKNMIYPIVIQGIECMVGGYEVYGNAIMDIVDASGKREVYATNDATKLTTNVSKIKETYSKSKYSINGKKLNSWNYITKIDFDFDNGVFVQSSTGEEGSSTSTGFADGVYFDAASSGQREFLGFGLLWDWSIAGLSCLAAYLGLGYAGWNCLGRISINGVGGELTTQ